MPSVPLPLLVILAVLFLAPGITALLISALERLVLSRILLVRDWLGLRAEL